MCPLDHRLKFVLDIPRPCGKPPATEWFSPSTGICNRFAPVRLGARDGTGPGRCGRRHYERKPHEAGRRQVKRFAIEGAAPTCPFRIPRRATSATAGCRGTETFDECGDR